MSYVNTQTQSAEQTSHTDNHDTEAASNSTNHDDEKERQQHQNNEDDIVDWDGDNDPEHPLHWPKREKWRNMFGVTILLLVMNLGSAAISPGTTMVMTEFNRTSTELKAAITSIFTLGFTFGPLSEAPISDIYGRRIVYLGCLVFYIIFSICCALSRNITMLIIFRFLAGMSASQTAGGTIGDLFSLESRGVPMAVYAFAPMAGNGLSPIIGGYIAQCLGWRWVFWINAIAAAPVFIIALFTLRETDPNVLIEKKAKKLGKKASQKAKNNTKFSWSTLTTPCKMLLDPMVFFLGLYVAYLYGLVYIFLTAMSLVFKEQYGFNTGEIGISYAGIAIGMALGSLLTGHPSDQIYAKTKKKNNGEAKPEVRLWPAAYTSFLLPIGLFWYAWTAEEKVHWIVPIIATSLLGISMTGAFVAVQTYMVDAYPDKSGDGLAATTFLRCIFGTLLPLGGTPLYDKLGFGWGNSLLGFISLGLVPIPFVFLKYGEKLRKKTEQKEKK